MKKTLLLLSLMAFVMASHAQESRRERALAKRNHVTIDPISLLAGPILNISYERVVTEDIGVGVNGLFGLRETDQYNDWIDDVVQVSPYARLFLAGSHGAGFFMDAFIPITNTRNYFDDNNSIDGYHTGTGKRSTSVGVGIGIGGKWMLKRNLV